MDSKEPMTFEKFSSLRRRQQSALDTNSVAAAAEAAGVNTAAIPPAALMSSSKGLQDDSFHASFRTKQYFLLVVFLDILCVVFELLHGTYGAQIERTLKNHDNPTMPKLILPTYQAVHNSLGYIAWLVWLVSFGEIVIYVVACWEVKRFQWLRVVDGVTVLGHGGVLAMAAPTAARLLVLLRVVRVAECLTLVLAELSQRTQRLDGRYLTERHRAELLVSQLEQMQSKLQREVDARSRLETAARQWKDEADELREALLVAAQDMAAAEAEVGRPIVSGIGPGGVGATMMRGAAGAGGYGYGAPGSGVASVRGLGGGGSVSGSSQYGYNSNGGYNVVNSGSGRTPARGAASSGGVATAGYSSMASSPRMPPAGPTATAAGAGDQSAAPGSAGDGVGVSGDRARGAHAADDGNADQDAVDDANEEDQFKEAVSGSDGEQLQQQQQRHRQYLQQQQGAGSSSSSMSRRSAGQTSGGSGRHHQQQHGAGSGGSHHSHSHHTRPSGSASVSTMGRRLVIRKDGTAALRPAGGTGGY